MTQPNPGYHSKLCLEADDYPVAAFDRPLAPAKQARILRLRRTGSSTYKIATYLRLIESALGNEALLGSFTGRRPLHSLDEAFGRCWSDHTHRLASASNIAYQSDNVLNGLGRDLPIDAPGDDLVARYVTTRRGQKGRHGKRRNSDASVNRELTLLRAVLRMAARRWSWRVAATDWRAHWLVEPASRDRILTAAEAERLIAAAAPHLAPAIEFSLLTGMRLGNCMTLDWSQVDLLGRQIAFRIESRRPGGKPHVLPITGPLLVLLANLGPRDAGPVFTYKGRRITKWQIAWAGALRQAKTADFRWHDLRHTVASWIVQNGVPLGTAKEILGHESIATTLRYAHRESDAKHKALEAAVAHFRHSGIASDGQTVGKKRRI